MSLDYNRKFGNHFLGALLLWENINEYSEGVNANAGNILSPAVPYIFTADPDLVTVGSSASEYGRQGLVGRINYNYKEKVFGRVCFP